MRMFIIAIAVMIASVFIHQCIFAAESEAADITVVFVPKLTGNSFFEAANEGAQRYAERIGFTVLYRGSAEATVGKQIEIIEEAIRSGAKGLCVSSVSATGLDNVLRKARAAGMAVTTWDSDVSPDARSVMVAQGTPAILGAMLVEMGVKSLAARGKDPGQDAIRYAWHYSQGQAADQNSWREAGEIHIKQKYPKWVNINPNNFYSEQNPDKALRVGEAIFSLHPDIDLVICNDSTALPGQCQAAENFGLDKSNVTITGFAAPNAIKDYCRSGIIERWGLWDCQVQGALGCYLAYYLAGGGKIKVGDRIDVPEIGLVEVLPNSVLNPDAAEATNSGIVLLPERLEFTVKNMDKYDF